MYFTRNITNNNMEISRTLGTLWCIMVDMAGKTTMKAFKLSEGECGKTTGTKLPFFWFKGDNP